VCGADLPSFLQIFTRTVLPGTDRAKHDDKDGRESEEPRRQDINHFIAHQARRLSWKQPPRHPR